MSADASLLVTNIAKTWVNPTPYDCKKCYFTVSVGRHNIISIAIPEIFINIVKRQTDEKAGLISDAVCNHLMARLAMKQHRQGQSKIERVHDVPML